MDFPNAGSSYSNYVATAKAGTFLYRRNLLVLKKGIGKG